MKNTETHEEVISELAEPIVPERPPFEIGGDDDSDESHPTGGTGRRSSGAAAASRPRQSTVRSSATSVGQPHPSPEKILIKYHVGMPKISVAENSDWIDLRAAETVVLRKGEYRVISLGISVKLPSGYEAHIAPRSSTFRRYGVIQTNGVGVIDESYCGDNDIWGFPVLAMRDTSIRRGDRICQFRIMKKMGNVVLETVNELSATSRGGFGSTGVN